MSKTTATGSITPRSDVAWWENVEVRFTEIVPLPAVADPDGRGGGDGVVPCERSSHGLSYIPPGPGAAGASIRLFLHGGEREARTPLDPSQMTWVAEEAELDQEQSRRDGGGDGEGDHRRCRWRWRPIGGGEHEKGQRPPPRVAHAQAYVSSERAVYVFGGRTGVDMGETAMNDLWRFDLDAELWSVVVPSATDGGDSPRPQPRSFHRMIAVGDSDLYVFGGCGAGGRLSDLWRFDTAEGRWHDLGESKLLRGRGGPNLLHLTGENGGDDYLAVVAGFAGEETRDGHRFRLAKDGKGVCGWEDAPMDGLDELRPRSVCVSGSFRNVGDGGGSVGVIFGGEVNPSDRGHEGAGGFANDVVLLEGGGWSGGGGGGRVARVISPPAAAATAGGEGLTWPEARGWADGAVAEDVPGVDGYRHCLYLFGGLAGDDENPKRLGDLWRCDMNFPGGSPS